MYMRLICLAVAGACGANLIVAGHVAEGLGIFALASAQVFGDREHWKRTEACIKAVRDLLNHLGD